MTLSQFFSLALMICDGPCLLSAMCAAVPARREVDVDWITYHPPRRKGGHLGKNRHLNKRALRFVQCARHSHSVGQTWR
jgi:hypothetical protein